MVIASTYDYSVQYYNLYRDTNLRDIIVPYGDISDV